MRAATGWIAFTVGVVIVGTLTSPVAAQTSALASAPAEATGLCRDGMYTYSKEKKGSCRNRHGIQEWFADSRDAKLTVGAAAPTENPAPSPASVSDSAPIPDQDHRIHIVYMGGNDCPPCVYWRANDLPRLKTTAAFRSVTFTYVQKTILSPVPPAMFLPAEVKTYKNQLDAAGGGIGGSAQVAIFVDDQLFDYYFGSRSAEEVEQMILSIRKGTKYPFERCVKRNTSRGCSTKGT